MTAADVSVTALGSYPTPLHRLHGIERELGLGPLYTKRDDLNGFALAGNKTRPLRYLIADAQAAGAHVLVAGGRPESNFCAAAAVAARSVGLGCELVIATPSGEPEAGANIALARAAGASMVWVRAKGDEIDAAISAHADRLTAGGRPAYAIPRGGSTPLGAMGFADAAGELTEQLRAAGADRATVVCAVGSGGSCAGLLVGRTELGADWTLTGVSVSRPAALLADHLAHLTQGCAALRGCPAPELADLELVDATDTPHGVLTPRQRTLARTAYRCDGLLLDATYTAKAFEVAVHQAGEQRDRPTVFWHTGGTVAALSSMLAAQDPENPDNPEGSDD